MNAFVAKEIRLLLPAYGLALLLAVFPVWLAPVDAYRQGTEPHLEGATHALFALGAVLLALSSFGRELILKTFPLLLAQPVERARIWRIKVALLAAALATVWAAWMVSCATRGAVRQAPVFWNETLLIGGVVSVAALAGGLWTTLLLRQVAAAFWFTVLIPVALVMGVAATSASLAVLLVVLGIYVVAGFAWARRAFLRAQDVHWTGGVIALPGWKMSGDGSRTPARSFRPLAALIRKEFQLHQIALIAMGGLFLLHLGVVLLRKLELQSDLRTALDVFGGIWLLAPVLIGGQSVAEERKLGTWASHLSLPVSLRLQFAIKLFFVLLLGGVLSPVLMVAAESSARVLDVRTVSPELLAVGRMILIFCILAWIGFYASTLSQGLLQVMASAGLVLVGMAVLWELLGRLDYSGRYSVVPADLPWRGPLAYYVIPPLLGMTLAVLTWRNFRQLSEGWRMWRRNVAALAATLGCGVLLTSVVYHRVWEWAASLEPVPGPARLSAATAPKISCFNSALSLLWPDGRLALSLFTPHPLESGSGVRFSLTAPQPVPGSNWMATATGWRETVGVRGDGTLWIIENLSKPASPPTQPASLEDPGMARFGNDSDWASVVQGGIRHNFHRWFLLKKDGSLWRWGSDHFDSRKPWPGLRTFEPERIRGENNWTNLVSGASWVVGWKRDGTAWRLNPPADTLRRSEPEADLRHLAALDSTQWRSVQGLWTRVVGTREDGTLWLWQAPYNYPKHTEPFKLIQVGHESNWVQAGASWQSVIGARSDGSLWRWNLLFSEANDVEFVKPVRLGKRRDWVGVVSTPAGTFSLAADGSLWFWWGPEFHNSDSRLLAPSRRPVRVGNILE